MATTDNGILHTIEGTNQGNSGTGGRVGNRTGVRGQCPDLTTTHIPNDGRGTGRRKRPRL